jgi:hypothetical protein
MSPLVVKPPNQSRYCRVLRLSSEYAALIKPLRASQGGRNACFSRHSTRKKA